MSNDRVVERFRDEITALDVRLVSTINARIDAVKALAEYKAEHGIAFVDPEREAALVAHLKIGRASCRERVLASV